MVTKTQVYQALSRVIDPELRRNPVESGMIRDVTISDGQVNCILALTTLACPFKDQLVRGFNRAPAPWRPCPPRAEQGSR